MWSTVEEIANSAIEDGRKVVSTTGMTEPGVQGVVRKVSTEFITFLIIAGKFKS